MSGDDDWGDDDDDAPPTGHDVHFLSRINERVDYEQADLALRLYRDAALVKALLDDEAPSNAGRVAIALAAGPAPPHVIIERGGRFVTCLATGMALDDTPVVPRERLEVHLQRAALRAERDAQIRAVLANGPGVVRRLVARVRHAGSRLTREEVEQLVVVAPMLEHVFLERYFTTIAWLATRAPYARRLKRLSPSVEPKLLNFWNRYHAVGHYLVLASTRGKDSFAVWEAQPEASERLDVWATWYLQNPVSLGRGFVALRAWWALGRAGTLAVPRLKRAITEEQNLGGWFRAAYALLAIARRHQKLRGELERAVGPARLPLPARGDERACALARHVQWLMTMEWNSDPAPEEQERGRLSNAEELVAIHDRKEEPGERPGDELSIARLAHVGIDLCDPKEGQQVVAVAVALIATSRPEELYFPAARIDEAPRFTPEAAHALANFAPAPPTTARAAESTGRNEPCPCGSGKKFKKCCGLMCS